MNKLFFRYSYFFVGLLMSTSYKMHAMDMGTTQNGSDSYFIDYLNDDVAEVPALLSVAPVVSHIANNNLEPKSTIVQTVTTNPGTTVPVPHSAIQPVGETVVPAMSSSPIELKTEPIFPSSSENVAKACVKTNFFSGIKTKCVWGIVSLQEKKLSLIAYLKDAKARGWKALERKEQIAAVLVSTAIVATSAYIIYKIYKSYSNEQESKNKNRGYYN